MKNRFIGRFAVLTLALSGALSISALARQCGTSESTVMRLCRSLGLERFPELRLAVARAASRDEARFGDGVIELEMTLRGTSARRRPR